MAVGKFYDDIDVILKSMAEYLGIEEEDEYFDDIFDDDEDSDDDDLIDDVTVTMADVEKCGSILEKYIDELLAVAKKPDDEKIMKIVEKTVKKLNKLNDACECELIESTTSDDICEFMHNAAVDAGLSVIPENVCDEWREF